MTDTTNTVAKPKEPHAVAMTSAPANTFVDIKIPKGDGVLMYWPEQNGFLALYRPEYREFHAEADEHSKKIAALQDANHKVTEAAVVLREAQKSGVVADIKKADAALEKALNDMQQASEEVKKKLEPLSKMDAKGGVKMVELVSLRTPKYKDKPVPIYVKSTTLKKVLADNRIHLIESEKEKRHAEKLFKDGKLDTHEIKNRIADKVHDKSFKKEWKLKPGDAEAYSGVLTDWAKTMNGDVAKFLERQKDDVERKFNIDPKDAHRNIDLSADAQLMRYTGGAGLELNFKPFQGNLSDKRDDSWAKRAMRGAKSGELGIKANAKASFAIAEGRIRTEVYWPHFAGWHATATVATETFELGYWRFYGNMILSGSAGASLAIELDVGISYTGGKQGVRGIPAAQKKKGAVKVHAGAGGELDAFAGARVAIDAKGALQWLNPEGAESNGKPHKIKPSDAIAEYKDMAKVDAGVAGMAGAGVKAAFAIKHEDGKFVIYAKLGACLGLGGDATMKFETGVDTIGEFFKCIAYQLKRVDYHKITDAIDEMAYKTYCQVKYMIIAKGRQLEDYVDKSIVDINRDFNNVVDEIDNSIRRGSHEAEEFMRQIRIELDKQTASWLSYAAPEVLGQVARQIAAAGLCENRAINQQAPELMALVLSAPQTMNHLATVAERMTPVMGDKQDEAAGMAMINTCVAGTAYADCLDKAQQRLAKAQPMYSKPFIWNSEPDFIVAKLGIEHPMYA
jgi:hypothetical protein